MSLIDGKTTFKSLLGHRGTKQGIKRREEGENEENFTNLGARLSSTRLALPVFGVRISIMTDKSPESFTSDGSERKEEEE